MEGGAGPARFAVAREQVPAAGDGQAPKSQRVGFKLAGRNMLARDLEGPGQACGAVGRVKAR